MINDLVEDRNFRIIPVSTDTKMIVVADDDIIRNDVRRAGSTETPLPLGQDRYTLQQFGNKDFLINSLNYLVDNNGLMELRSRELKLRQLDKTKVRQERFILQVINIAGPLTIVMLAGFVYNILRKRMNTKY
jgi:ABC-2 type transport system permease protein